VRDILGAVTATDTATEDPATLAGEYATLTERCGLVDRSERGKLALTGAGAVEFLNGQVTNELVGLKPGDGCYAAFLTHKGKMLGDLRVLAVAERKGAPSAPDGRHVEGDEGASQPRELLLDTERMALQALFDMIRRFKVGYEVELHKRTLERSLLSLIGPDANAVATKAFAADPASGHGPGEPPEREDGHVLVRLELTPVRLIRTDMGIDALFDSGALEAVRGALRAAGATEVSEAAAEIVRVEHGRPRYGIDLDESTIPQEAGLNERAVSFTKGCYVGQETVARLHYKGKPNRHLRGLRLSAPVEPGAELRLGERPVGHLGSSVVSPALGPIGLALVRREAEPGMTVTVPSQGATGLAPPSAVVTELPFA
jgi:folate-binding protein YgfZ